MSSSMDKSSSSKRLLSGQNVVYAGIAWAVLALLFYLLFSTPVPGEEGLPFWYSMGTYIFEEVPFLAAAVLCFRNFRSPQIASGRNVWLGIGLGMLSFFIGNLVFGWWELGWGLDPDVSPADLFFVGFYVLLSAGMTLAVISRRLNLEIWQWGIVAAIAVAGIALAVWLSFPEPATASSPPPATASLPATTLVSDRASPNLPAAPKAAKLTPTLFPATPVVTKLAANPTTANSEPSKQPPAWVLSLQKQLEPFADPLGFFYIVCDVFLLIMSAILLLSFWGGRFAQSWRMIAAAAFSFYIADMWFNYAINRIPEYQSGSLLEVFWVFSGVLFAIGTSLEYELSSRSRRAGGRKRA